MRWGERETCIFVNLYLRKDVLWNPDNIDYKSKIKKSTAYKHIIEGFRAATGILLTEREVKMKIRSLRSTYCQELIKIRDRSEGGHQYTPRLKWFEQWHRRFNKVANSVSDTTESNEPEDDSSLNIDDDNYETKFDPFAPHSEDDLLVKPELHEESNEDDHSDHIPLKVKKTRGRSSPNADTRESFPRISYLTSPKEDEFDIYGKYIATQLRSMDLANALRVQIQIQNIVSEARLSNC